MARAALDVLADLDDDAFVEIKINKPHATPVILPVGYLRHYLAAQFVPGRQVLVFDSDEEVSSDVAAEMLGVSPRYLKHLLDDETIPHRHFRNQRYIRVLDLNAWLSQRSGSSQRPDLF
ncbi:MAG TPA: helix-turn-helix domain-containing protein [Conexibacter sp.]|nr:helix-turn-helix domain-containing protein [Conexibacter sp.]